MSSNLDKIYEDALTLPDESKAVLAERIVEYLETHVAADLERAHLDTVRRRRDEMKSGKVEPIDGHDASVMARRIIKK
ncbi:MAG: addiction module protein [Desulfomonilaceae bacterium]|nr:addiction module protein [Desulfomonilaceae bacterium]